MTTEENKHKEEVERATQLWEGGDISREQLEYIFPELKESEEDRIRKEITELIMKPTWQTEKEFNRRKELAVWLEKQGEIDKESYEIAEKEKYNFVSGHFIECRKSFNEFKEDNSYWLEYIGNDTYIGRSDNILNQKFHITPRQLFTLFTVEHCPKNDENDEDKESEDRFEKPNGGIEDKPNGGIVLEDCSEGEGFYKVNLAYLSKEQVEEIENIVKKWNPKLAESEDEKIRKGLIKALSSIGKRNWGGIDVFESIAWLEKQGVKPQGKSVVEAAKEEKVDNRNCINNADKEEAKFQAGDWVISNITRNVYHVLNIENNRYRVETLDGIFWFDKNYFDSFARLWNISDAKTGDVLAEDSCIFIIQKFGEYSTAAKTYCTLFNDGDFEDGAILYFDIDSTKPATIEQREQLFKKMEEEGYTWDAENKELKKLEKQYNPKFKVGDWIVDKSGLVQQVLNFRSGIYSCTYNSFTTDSESNYHLWTISDAKPGDVLATNSWLYVFKYTNNKNLIQFYYTCPINGETFKWCFLPNDSYLDIYIDANIHPATKEQQKLLFEKMTDAGYEWNAEKKELKKIESNPDKLIEESYQQQADDLIDMVTENSTWNEDDEKNLQGVIDEIQANKSNAPEYDVKTYDRFLSWLKSFKDRIQPQPKQDGKWKWEEDDEKFFKENILIELGNIDGVSPELYSKIIDWISLIKKRLS